MGSFMKGMTFTMDGKEYEVISVGDSEPSSEMVYVPSEDKDTAYPLTLRAWKAEAKLARGDIMISGYTDNSQRDVNEYFRQPIDPLEQIAELKKRIHAIERRRLSLLKIDDPKGLALLQDNVIRPNVNFDIWNYTRASGDIAKRECMIQYIKMRGLILSLASATHAERYLFNIAEHLQPPCHISGDTLSAAGGIKIDLSSRTQTLQGFPTQILTADLGGKIELNVKLGLKCLYRTGTLCVSAQITHAGYLREVNGPALKMSHLTFPEIGEHSLAIEGIAVEIYTDGSRDF